MEDIIFWAVIPAGSSRISTVLLQIVERIERTRYRREAPRRPGFHQKSI